MDNAAAPNMMNLGRMDNSENENEGHPAAAWQDQGDNKRPQSVCQIRKKMAPPDLRGGIPLRPFRRRSVDGGQRDNIRIRRSAGPLQIQWGMPCIDCYRSVMTRSAVRVYGEFFHQGWRIFGSDRELVTIFDVLVVTEVLRCATCLVHAIRSHRRPAELESDNCGNDVHEATDHGRNIAWTGKGLPAGPHSAAMCHPVQHAD